MSDNWEKVTVGGARTLTKEDAGATVEGYYVGKTKIKSMNPDGNWIYTFQQEDGTEVEVFGFTALNRVMSKVSEKSYVKIVYTGKIKTNKGFNMHSVDVFLDKVKKLEGEEIAF